MTALIQKYLKANHYHDKQQAFEELFSSHPDYPSVFAITDTLDALTIENTAVQVSKEQFNQLPVCFLAIFGDELAMVIKKAGAIAIETEKGKKDMLPLAVFVKDWTGVVIVMEPGTAVTNKKMPPLVKWLRYSLPFCLLAAASFTFNQYSVSSITLLLTSLTGILVSIFIIREKLGMQHSFISGFCNINTATSCNAVIQSGSYRINRWMHFTDLPLLFFSVNVMAILLQPVVATAIAGVLSMAALPVIAYTLWVQHFRLKKWCMLCLAVSLLIVLQAAVFAVTELPLNGIAGPGVFYYLFAGILITAAWLAIQPVIESNVKTGEGIKGLMKFKRNYALYRYLSAEIPFAEGFDALEGLRLGNKKAGVRLTLIVSPSCGFCHDAVEAAFDLVRRYPGKICMHVLFNINPGNQDNPFKVVAERLLSVNEADQLLANEALSDWHINKPGLEAWTQKWQTGPVSRYVKEQLQQQYHWCMTNGFNYSPVKIVNGRLMPNEYEIGELKYFLNELERDRAVAGKPMLVYR